MVEEFRVVMDLVGGDLRGSTLSFDAPTLEAARVIAANPEAFFDKHSRGYRAENVRIQTRTISAWTVVDDGGKDA